MSLSVASKAYLAYLELAEPFPYRLSSLPSGHIQFAAAVGDRCSYAFYTPDVDVDVATLRPSG